MKVYARRFNLFLTLAVAILLCGCQTEKHKQDKKVSALRVHIEVNTDNAGDMSTAQTISVLRSEPVVVTIAKEPVLTEANIIAAKVIESPGGFSIAVQFDEIGSLMLEQYSATNPGKHFVIFGQWGEKAGDGRWLAAPLITHHIANGLLSFTPDASPEESERLVLGLNNVAKKIHKGSMK